MPEERTGAGANVDAVETKPYVIFKLGDEEFGVDVKNMNIKEIAKITTITRVPRSADFIEGVTNHRGSLVTVINLRKRFGLKHKDIDADSRIIIAEFEDNPVGMLVDAAEVLMISVTDIDATAKNVTAEISKEYQMGVGKSDNRQIILLDLKRVLAKEEG